MPDKYRKMGKHIFANGTAISERIQAKDVLNELIKGYFGHDIYLAGGLGFKSPLEFVENNKGKHERIVDAAIAHNRIRFLSEKNFFFSGDEALRKQVMMAYDNIAAGTYDPVELAMIQTVIRSKRRDVELAKRVHIMLGLDPTANRVAIEQEALNKVGEGQPVDLKSEIEMAQKGQLARSINAKALELVFGGDMDEYSSKIKLKIIDEHLGECVLAVDGQPLDKPINVSKLKKHLPNLPEKQREPYFKQILDHANNLRLGLIKIKKEWPKELGNTPELQQILAAMLLPPDAINLLVLNAEYTGSADKHTSKEDSDKVLDQLRAGLIMHVASDSKFAVGTSIKSVLSTQQAILNNNDELNDVLIICQLHGRTIRDKEGIALYQQVMAEGVHSFFKLSDILALETNQ